MKFQVVPIPWGSDLLTFLKGPSGQCQQFGGQIISVLTSVFSVSVSFFLFFFFIVKGSSEKRGRVERGVRSVTVCEQSIEITHYLRTSLELCLGSLKGGQRKNGNKWEQLWFRNTQQTLKFKIYIILTMDYSSLNFFLMILKGKNHSQFTGYIKRQGAILGNPHLTPPPTRHSFPTLIQMYLSRQVCL